MHKYTFEHNGFTFDRINRKRAKTAYMNGLTILITACNLHPFSMWNTAIPLNREDEGQSDFDRWIDAFSFYNCTDSETGKYPAFYIPVRDVDRFTGKAPTAETLDTITEYDYRFMAAKKTDQVKDVIGWKLSNAD